MLGEGRSSMRLRESEPRYCSFWSGTIGLVNVSPYDECASTCLYSPGSNRARMTVTPLVSGELALAIGVK